MKTKSIIYILLPFLLLSINTSYAQSTDKMIIIIIDGARYTETLGDATRTYTPAMWNLAEQGTIIDQFKNNGYTYTSRAIPALWSGDWTDVRDTTYNNSSTKFSVSPSLFEYYRKQKAMPVEECVYVMLEVEDLWLPSFNSDYGPNYWPTFHSTGHSDAEVAVQAKIVIDDLHPHFMWVYLADVDHAGHSGNWSEYVEAIRLADQIVGDLWRHIQADPFYKGTTTLFVTNDHGRHDDQHGGFRDHGDNCDGCRHIEFLAVGPSIKENYVSHITRNIPDMAVTAANLLGLDPDYSTGNVMSEIYKANGIEEEIIQSSLLKNYPNPFQSSTNFQLNIAEAGYVTISIYDIFGKEVVTINGGWKGIGEHTFSWDATNQLGLKTNPGVYFYDIQLNNNRFKGKLLLQANEL